MSKRSGALDTPKIASLSLEDDDDLFASPESGATTQKHTPASATQRPQAARTQTKQDIEDARNAQLQAELEKVREVNRVIEGVTASLTKAKGNMENVHRTVNNASTLLATWTRILSQTEHNQRVILNPNFQGASQDLEDIENDEVRRQQDFERRAFEQQRRQEEAQRKAEEEERKKAASEATRTRAGLNRTRSTRGTTTSSRGYTGVGGQAGRGRGLTANSRGTSSYGRVASTTRGRGRGLG
ncbi:Putative DASH complex subunit Duo1 protein [Septoria linicola]|uniref:DASH complex subunit DUO1 n=1 Tax=Septoria linicola TaxID=215465 RepID=A0A9Q9AUX3_9PEZI|nr:putative DASH complex subunit Duo1 protein [Septoria linicola]USW55284.1 Putative DASH complex subunit Duo1 protein [Septoria linicola]